MASVQASDLDPSHEHVHNGANEDTIRTLSVLESNGTAELTHDDDRVTVDVTAHQSDGGSISGEGGGGAINSIHSSSTGNDEHTPNKRRLLPWRRRDGGCLSRAALRCPWALLVWVAVAAVPVALTYRCDRRIMLLRTRMRTHIGLQAYASPLFNSLSVTLILTRTYTHTHGVLTES